ncbi:MAG: putative invasin, partial [Frankiales bacterium]|nr:putative invasin [Frankiales bacterium]
ALKNATVTVEGSSTVYSTGPGAADVVIGGLASGAHDITVLTPDGQQLTQSVSVSVGGDSPIAFAFSAPPVIATGSVTITVTKNGAAVPGASVTITAQAAALTTNPSGQVTFTGVTPGTYAVTASKSGQSVTQNITTSAPSSSLTLALPADPPATAAVTVTVTDGGAAVSGASIVVFSGSTSASGSTDASGTATVSGLPSGTYTVTASTVSGRSGSTSGVVLTAGSTATTSVALSAAVGRLDVTVTRGGATQAGATVTLSGTASRSGTTDGSGNISFTDLPAGDYSVSATFSTTTPAKSYSGGPVAVSVVSGGTAAKTVAIS